MKKKPTLRESAQRILAEKREREAKGRNGILTFAKGIIEAERAKAPAKIDPMSNKALGDLLQRFLQISEKRFEILTARIDTLRESLLIVFELQTILIEMFGQQHPEIAGDLKTLCKRILKLRKEVEDVSQ